MQPPSDSPPAPPSQFALGQILFAEGLGTFLLVFLGCGAVHAAVLLGAQSGIWQVAIVWGLAIMLAIFTVGSISGAHLNPAMTISFAVWGRFPWNRVAPYLMSQLLGAVAAALVLLGLFGGFLVAKEREKGVVRGEPGSIVTAMCFGEYFPNPGPIATSAGPYDPTVHADLRARFGHLAAFLAEFLGTAILGCVVFALTDDRNGGRPSANLAPVFIGLTVAALISVLAPLTQAGFNPARDLGPRLVAYFAGWKSIAIPGLNDPAWLTVYILAPVLGGMAGGGLHQYLLRPINQATQTTSNQLENS